MLPVLILCMQHVQQQRLRLHAIVEMLFNEAACAGHTVLCTALLDHLQEARILLMRLLSSWSRGASVSGKDGLCLCTDIILDAPVST